jgi:hypothetical protein
VAAALADPPIELTNATHHRLMPEDTDHSLGGVDTVL